MAIYWISIDVGTPPKSFPVAIDSGSMTLDIQGPGCANCAPRSTVTAKSLSTAQHERQQGLQ